MLEAIVERPVTEAACPFGSYDRRVLRALRRAGYRTSTRATAARRGPATSLQARNSVGPHDEPTLLDRIAALDSAVHRCPTRQAGGEAVAVTPHQGARRGAPDRRGRRRRRSPSSCTRTSTSACRPTAWARAVEVPWEVERPNAGFMLLDGDADRRRPPRLLLGADDRRPHASASATSVPGACCPTTASTACGCSRRCWRRTATTSPTSRRAGTWSGSTRGSGFRFLDTTTAVVPNLPWPSRPGRDTISSDPDADRAHARAAPSSQHLPRPRRTRRGPPPRADSRRRSTAT